MLANKVEYRVQFELRGSIKQPSFICFSAAISVDGTGETPTPLYVRASQETLKALPDRIVIDGDEPVRVVVNDNGSERLVAKRILVCSTPGRPATKKLQNAAIEFVLTRSGGRRVVRVMAYSGE